VFAYVLVVLLFGAITIDSPSFASWFHVSAVLEQAAILGFAAAGETVVILGGGLDLSVPGMMSAAGVLFARIAPTNHQVWEAIAIVLAMAIVVGTVNGLIVAYLGAPSLIVTLGMNSVLAGGLLATTQGLAGIGSVPSGVADFAVGSVASIPVCLIAWCGLAALMWLVLTRTNLGRSIYALGSNREAALLAGVRVVRVEAVSYVVSAIGAAVAGVMLAGYLGQAYADMGDSYLFIAITAVILGGAVITGGSGHYFGTIAGSLILLFLDGLLTVLNLGPAVLEIAYGCVILASIGTTTFLTQRLQAIRR
jgi:ribose transport system permease protein